MYTFKFVGLAHTDAPTPYYYGSLPAPAELGGTFLLDDTGNRYVVVGIEGEGLQGEAEASQRELAWAEIARGERVPTLFLQKLGTAPASKVQGRFFTYEEVKEYSQHNRETRLAATRKS